jgi:hypothetical protein
MITITSGENTKDDKHGGDHIHEVKVNHKILFAVTYSRDDKLSAVLLKAANAAAQFEELQRITKRK